MIGLEDRQALAQDIDTAHATGARLQPSCEVAGIDVRTLQRWKAQEGLTAGDGRPQAVRPTPGHALSSAERGALLAVANEPRFASVPPARIVPMLADEGVYLGSESSMARVLREHGQNARRGRAKTPKAIRPWRAQNHQSDPKPRDVVEHPRASAPVGGPSSRCPACLTFRTSVDAFARNFGVGSHAQAWERDQQRQGR